MAIKKPKRAQNEAVLKTIDGTATCHVLLRSGVGSEGGYDILIGQRGPVADTWRVILEGTLVHVQPPG